MRVEDAKRIFPGYKTYPKIKATKSLILMQITAGWDTKKCIRVGDSYYYLKDHPNADEMFNTRSTDQTKKRDTQRKVDPLNEK